MNPCHIEITTVVQIASLQHGEKYLQRFERSKDHPLFFWRDWHEIYRLMLKAPHITIFCLFFKVSWLLGDNSWTYNVSCFWMIESKCHHRTPSDSNHPPRLPLPTALVFRFARISTLVLLTIKRSSNTFDEVAVASFICKSSHLSSIVVYRHFLLQLSHCSFKFTGWLWQCLRICCYKITSPKV